MTADLARHLVALPCWRWMPGMRWIVVRAAPLDSLSGRVPDSLRGWQPYPGAVPDLTDPATIGCLVALLREVSGDPEAHVYRYPFATGAPHWVVSKTTGISILKATEAEALVAAIEAACGAKP